MLIHHVGVDAGNGSWIVSVEAPDLSLVFNLPAFFERCQNQNKQDDIYHGGHDDADHYIAVALAEEAIAKSVDEVKERVTQADLLKERRQYIDVVKCAGEVR